MSAYPIDVKACIRCAACATAAPAHFTVAGGPAKLVRPPATQTERRACDGAAALCPTQAITAGAPSSEIDLHQPRVPGDLYPELIERAEGVRWDFADLPWSSFDPVRAKPLRGIVREMAYSEQATFSATQRFMQTFSDHLDFSQWISVWFYEETRHPMVLLKWLALAGETPDAQFVTRGRVSAPFMKSRTGTLVTNVISEVFAAEAYLSMARSSPEPLLAAIAQKISADEARHGASFFAFARQAIATSEQPDRERLDALKVLHFWLNENQAVSHPVNETMEKVRSIREIDGIIPPFKPPNDRIAKAVGRLTGLPIHGPGDVQGQLVALTAKLHAAAGE